MNLKYETVIAAVSGDQNAIEAVINEYEPYMMFLSIIAVWDENGKEHKILSQDALQMLREKLIKAIPKWKELDK